MEQIDSCQGGSGEWWKEGGRDQSKNMYERPMDMDNGEGIDCGSAGGAWLVGGGQRGKNWDNYNRINNN